MLEGDAGRIYRDERSYPYKRSGAEEKQRIGIRDSCKRIRLTSIAGFGFKKENGIVPST